MSFIIGITITTYSKTIFVSPEGKDSNNGTFNSPYKSLKKAISV